MCIPHGATGAKDSSYINTKPKKHVKKVAQHIFEKGDPNFVDERRLEEDSIKDKKSFLSSLFDD
ncbi:hypothetical protein HUE87_05995 [Candidatus Sulfurimonas marisnigri]|uniref:Uncharacterized protein n=1 Tax=Candidatus Sulfurimonas marisnigri TaxID=2740405 RepID=A0A7S7M2K4_9BACT|nr:hypothetical protein [Candidatus Sulfurimonas marisnigri]QOY55775.1 hypothetical protein HUE87_05995 [Candidatus Sulfurimonas marisnigri]